jgi:hypothetical protein
MADTAPAAQRLVGFIDAYCEFTEVVIRTIPRGHGAQYTPQVSDPIFEVELQIAGKLLAVREALDYESDDYLGPCLPGWDEGVAFAVRKSIRTLREFVRQQLNWNVQSINLHILRGEAAQRRVDLKEVEDAKREAMSPRFDAQRYHELEEQSAALHAAPLVSAARAVAYHGLESLREAASGLLRVRPQIAERAMDSKTPPDSKPPPPPQLSCRISFDKDKVIIDGTSYSVEDKLNLKRYRRIVDADGDYVRGVDIEKGRVDRKLKTLPAKVRETYQSKPGKGYRLLSEFCRSEKSIDVRRSP